MANGCGVLTKGTHANDDLVPCGTRRGPAYGLGKVSKTRSQAEVLSGHTAVVWIEGQAGCVALSHVEPNP